MNNNQTDSFPITPHVLRGFPLAIFLVTLTLPLLSGCDFRRVIVNHPIDPQALETLNSGKSSMQDVVRALGAPDDITASPDGMVWRYRYGDAKTMRINFGWVLRVFFPVAPSMNLGRGDDAPHVLHVAMNHDDIFDQYFLQQPLEPPQFSFWPF